MLAFFMPVLHKSSLSCELRELRRQEHIQLSHVKRIGVE